MTSTSQSLSRPGSRPATASSVDSPGEVVDRGLNLILDAWIPIQRADGSLDEIRPAQIRDFGPDGDNPPVALAANRPDFNGALIQFLIGLVQTTAAPKDLRQWWKIWRHAPDIDDLGRLFAPFSHAFELEGESAHFMQDLDPLSERTPKSVIQMLFDTPTGQSLNHNKDHFIKNRGEPGICPRCAAMSVLTLQLNATAGGAGHRTSLRGGGPLTTVISAPTLWETIWLNVLPTDKINNWSTIVPEAAQDIFPWLAPTRTSESKSGVTTTPLDVHPAQVYWGMPRRVRLRAPSSAENAHCELCAAPTNLLYTQYVDKNYGVNYQGPWEHPLTPYSTNKDGSPNPAKGQPGGLSYRHWCGYVVNHLGGSQVPARVVRAFYERDQQLQGDPILSNAPRLWVFGYDVDKAKVRAWNESIMPLFMVPEEVFEEFERRTNDFVATADFVAYIVLVALKNALYGTPTVSDKGKITWRIADGISNDSGLFQQVNMSFWERTEDAFYARLTELHQKLVAAEDVLSVQQAWAKILRAEAIRLFDENSQFGAFYGVDPKAVSLARRNVLLSTTAHNKKFRTTLDLPKPKEKK